MSEAIDERLIDTLRNARQLVVLTGAGVSAESGIATFRDDATGLWNQVSLEDYSTLEGFLRQPQQHRRLPSPHGLPHLRIHILTRHRHSPATCDVRSAWTGFVRAGRLFASLGIFRPRRALV